MTDSILEESRAVKQGAFDREGTPGDVETMATCSAGGTTELAEAGVAGLIPARSIPYGFMPCPECNGGDEDCSACDCARIVTATCHDCGVETSGEHELCWSCQRQSDLDNYADMRGDD